MGIWKWVRQVLGQKEPTVGREERHNTHLMVTWQVKTRCWRSSEHSEFREGAGIRVHVLPREGEESCGVAGEGSGKIVPSRGKVRCKDMARIRGCWVGRMLRSWAWRKEEVLGLSHWPEKPTWVWGTCQLITKWSFYFPFVAVPCMCKTAARRWSGWAEQDSSAPWVLPPNSSKCSRPSNSKSGPRGDESRGVWEENDKEPWKSTAGKEEPLEVSE